MSKTPSSDETLLGLTSQEVAERVAAGKTNADTDVKTKTIGQIFREHAFTLFNFVNVALAVLVAITGQYKNMTFMIVVLINLVVGVVQEVRAKRMVDKLSIITANKVRVIRDGIVRHTGSLASLKRFKDDAKEVTSGYECGFSIQSFNDLVVGDIVEAFEEVEVQKTL